MQAHHGRAFHARLEHTESKIYRAVYRGDLNANDTSGGTLLEGEHVQSDTHIGTDEEAVINFVEVLAAQRGYSHVVWESSDSDVK
jgi:hypothetical protein